ncbi:hypothetical protein EHF33_15570 [Deinococcus psychrotolerans]|uniref:Uncharacterized protein n=1 Tax=Deinococcus psychrotolerans TaxID=2489213 RepID=A0A3G8YJ46_9DEIO|nr:hypothetical protein [Deinococcus psychrotolerans]AZI44307.1 hypothetical protein EHF33_15570 [Deinococcus psychrotolerans]
MKRREDGSVLLLVLMVSVILMALLAAEVTMTRYNLKVVTNATVSAQLDVQAILSTPDAMRDVVARLPTELSLRVPNTSPTSSNFSQTLQRTLDQDWAQCSLSGPVVTNVYLGQYSCGLQAVGAPSPNAVMRRQINTHDVQEVRLPLLLNVTASSSLGKSTRQARGEAVYRQNVSANALPITTFQVISDQLGLPIPEKLIFDGPVQINGSLKFALGRSEFLGGVSSATPSLLLGDTLLTPTRFAPSVAFPCEQLSGDCPKFNAGLSLSAPRLIIPTLTDSPDITLNGIQELVLAPSPQRGTIVYACTASACDRYWYGPKHLLFKHILTSPVPPLDGLTFTPPEPTDPMQQAWTQLSDSASGLLLVNGDVSVRALTPNGPAFQNALTVAATGTVTVTSSLNALQPLCSTFTVRNDDGSLTPATCNGITPDLLGLASLGGNIDLSSAADETELNLQASLLAPSGSVSIQAANLKFVKWVGSVAAHSFTPDVRMHLAQDARGLNPPAFPLLPMGMTPPTIRLETDGMLNADSQF